MIRNDYKSNLRNVPSADASLRCFNGEEVKGLFYVTHFMFLTSGPVPLIDSDIQVWDVPARL